MWRRSGETLSLSINNNFSRRAGQLKCTTTRNSILYSKQTYINKSIAHTFSTSYHWSKKQQISSRYWTKTDVERIGRNIPIPRSGWHRAMRSARRRGATITTWTWRVRLPKARLVLAKQGSEERRRPHVPREIPYYSRSRFKMWSVRVESWCDVPVRKVAFLGISSAETNRVVWMGC